MSMAWLFPYFTSLLVVLEIPKDSLDLAKLTIRRPTRTYFFHMLHHIFSYNERRALEWTRRPPIRTLSACMLEIITEANHVSAMQRALCDSELAHFAVSLLVTPRYILTAPVRAGYKSVGACCQFVLYFLAELVILVAVITRHRPALAVESHVLVELFEHQLAVTAVVWTRNVS